MKKRIMTGSAMIKRFKESSAPVLNVDNIHIYKGDFTIIMGASGAGKSTLLYALSGMQHLDEGQVLYQDVDIVGYDEKQMAQLRRDSFGFVFQQTHLVTHLTLFENVAVAGYQKKNRSSKDTEDRAKQLLKRLHVDHVMHQLPAKVSGGEAQRAAIARAIINEPALLFADEPTGALNRRNSDEVLSILQQLYEAGQSIAMVTHDLRAAAYGTRILYMEDGRILDELDLSACNRKEREAKVSEWLTLRMW